MTTKQKSVEPWPPARLRLPDSIEEIERGRQTQRLLFPEPPDDSKASRLARILPASTMEATP